jgi:membrane-associated phospholipid phosphatase
LRWRASPLPAGSVYGRWQSSVKRDIAMKEILYDWGGANVWLFHTINNVHGGTLDQAMLLGTYLGGHTLFAMYFALAAFAAYFCVSRASRNDAATFQPIATLWLAALAVFSIAYLIDGAVLGWLKPLLDFPRPALALPAGSMHIVGRAEFHHSLPSGHSSFAMLVAASLWPVLNRWGRITGVIFVLWVGISRISLGAHFPADVLAGFLSSFVTVILVRWTITGVARVAARYPKPLANKETL